MIIREGQIHEYTAPYEVMLNLYPDQFVSEKKKLEESWVKINMDYFYTVGLSQYDHNRKSIIKNYELIKNKRTHEDYYEAGPIQSFVDELVETADLPKYVQPYSILTPPINGMVGEMTKRPDVSRPKAMDDDSKSEELSFYTQMLQGAIYDDAKQHIKADLLKKGADISNLDEFNQQVEQLTTDKVKEYMTSYTSTGERWANLMIGSLKVEFDFKEKSEEGFRDMLICNRQFYHVYENKTKTGFMMDVLNPKNVWYLTTPDKKYIRDAYAAGLIEIMELSEIISKFDLPVEEIEHLRNYAMQAFFPYSKESNLVKSNHGGTGIDSIQYNTYDPLVLEARTQMEARLQAENMQSLDSFLGNAAPNVGTYGMRFVVTTAYWESKKLLGLLTYIDKDGVKQTQFVDENYHEGDHPQEISIEWGYINQWYKGIKVGDDIYHVAPLEILDYCPIIGVVFEIKNTTSTSLVDMMKQFQILYDICLNQIYRFMQKEKGKIFMFNKRYIPLLRDGDYQDSEEIWLAQMEEEGICFVDDSPENLKTPSTGFNQITVVDMSFDTQMKARMELALALKKECWSLAGLTEARMGNVLASSTATGTNTELSQSYAQTEPYFVQHEYLMNQVLQAMLDAAMYVEGHKPESTVRFIDNEGGNKFISIQTASDLKGRDIKLFITSRAEDQEIFKNLRALSQPLLQNGADPYAVAEMFITNSVRRMRDILKEVRDKKEQFEQQNQQIEQQKVETEQKKNEADAQQAAKEHEDDIEIKRYEVDLRAKTAIAVEEMREKVQIAKENQADLSSDDLLKIAEHSAKEQRDLFDRDIKTLEMELNQKKMALQDMKDKKSLQQTDRKLDLQEEGIKSKERLAKMKSTTKK